MFSKRKSARTKRHIKHFKRKRIDYAKYIDDFYLDDGVAYISCNVADMKDIINAYSVKDYEILNSSFVDFIEENSQYIPVEFPIILEICGCKFTKTQQKTITETVADHFSLRLCDAQLELDNNRSKSLRLLVLGILSFCGLYALEALHILGGTMQEAADLLFWFFVWEWGDMVWLDRHDLLESKTMAARLASIKVVFREKFKDDHDSQEVTSELIAEVFEE